MNWAENFWIWMATEAFFAAFVALLLWYYFIKRPPNPRDEKPEKNKPSG
jgi:hypothetical protein